MYCPKCGNLQSSSEIQFCPSCGFALNAVRHLLATGGAPPTPHDAASAERKSNPSPRRKGIKQGTFMLLFAMIIVPMVAINEGPRDAATAAVFFFGIAIARLLYAMLIQCGDVMPKRDDMPFYMPTAMMRSTVAHEAPRNVALPASTAARVNTAPSRTTGQLVPPPSVTDHTTRLLEIRDAETVSRKPE